MSLIISLDLHLHFHLLFFSLSPEKLKEKKNTSIQYKAYLTQWFKNKNIK